MPRAFTGKERAYMARLAARNMGADYDGDDDAGLASPMPAAERMRRKRIRDKADEAMKDLVVADAAGLINFSELHTDHSMGLTFAMMDCDGPDDYAERANILAGRPPESVEFATDE